MISVEGLTVTFGAVTALRDLSLDFSESITGVIGPNGAGKTTLLDAIAGAVSASGSITLAGQELSSLSAFERARKGVRRSFQSSLLVDQLSVLDNVLVSLDAAGDRSSSKDKAMEVLTSLDLERLAAVPAGRLVNFERRMVGLARCLVASPKVLLLDEPGAGLVSDEKEQLAEAVTTAAQDYAETTILIEHDMEFVAQTCPTIAVLNFGTLLAEGPTGQVLSNPSVRAAYFGEEL